MEKRYDCSHWALIHFNLMICKLSPRPRNPSTDLSPLSHIHTALLVTLSGQVTLLDRDEEDAVVGSHEASYELVFVEKIVRDGLHLLYH